VITELSSVFTDNDISISHIAAYRNRANEFVMRVEETDKAKVRSLLEAKGFIVISVS